MLKICFIQKELKDTNLQTGMEKVNFYILKVLSEAGFQVDVFCRKNSLKGKYNINHITEISEENFLKNVFSIIRKLNYDLTFSTDYLPTDVAYLHKHTNAYEKLVVKSKINAILSSLFKFKKAERQKNESRRQKLFTEKYKLILTPSTVLKNDLINLLETDGQKIYILPPAIEQPEKIELKENEVFTFGFIGKDFANKGGFLLLNAMKSLQGFNFRVKIIYPYIELSKSIKLLLKLFKLEEKIEFLPWQDDMTEFYNSIDCLLVPSKKDSFSLSTLEAMARGKIVVVSSRCGVKDLIEPDNNGFIFNITSNPTRNLLHTMKYILINRTDFETMRKNAIYTAAVYNYEKFKEELIRILKKFEQEK